MTKPATARGADRRSLAQQAYEALRDRLIMLDIRPGDPVNEAALAAELGVGRTPVREALKRLAADHLVVSYPRRGTFAAAVDITDLAAIAEVREHLEPLAARRAAENPDPEVAAEARRLIDDLSALADEEDRRTLLAADLRIHRFIYRSTGNRHLADTLVRLDDLATRIWSLVLDRLPHLSGHVHEHAELLGAIAEGDGEGAARIARQHVRSFERRVRDSL